MQSPPKLRQLKDLIPLSEAAKLLPPKRGAKVHRETILRWAEAGCFRAYPANGWKVSKREFMAWAARTNRLAPHVLVCD
jgi:hypothetical protein